MRPFPGFPDKGLTWIEVENNAESMGYADVAAFRLKVLFETRRDCPEDAGLMSSYFSRCVLTANRDDFQDGSFTLSGQDIDRLDDPDQGGHKVAVRIVLQPE